MTTISDTLQDAISAAIDESVDTHEIMFELAKYMMLLAYANGNTKEGFLGALEEMFDSIYSRAAVLEARGEFNPQ